MIKLLRFRYNPRFEFLPLLKLLLKEYPYHLVHVLRRSDSSFLYQLDTYLNMFSVIRLLLNLTCWQTNVTWVHFIFSTVVHARQSIDYRLSNSLAFYPYLLSTFRKISYLVLNVYGAPASVHVL